VISALVNTSGIYTKGLILDTLNLIFKTYKPAVLVIHALGTLSVFVWIMSCWLKPHRLAKQVGRQHMGWLVLLSKNLQLYIVRWHWL
jgi:hypothetical protein